LLHRHIRASLPGWQLVEMVRESAPFSVKPTPNRGFSSFVPHLCPRNEKPSAEKDGLSG